MAMATLPLFSCPLNEPVLLPKRPRLASWMAASHPDQVRLGEFLDSAQSSSASRLARVEDPLALHLSVGLPATTALLDQHDLDNYLFPLAGCFAKSGRNIISVSASKSIAEVSYLTLDTATARDAEDDWAAVVALSASSQTAAFKEQVRAGTADLDRLADGPVSVELSFIVGPSRNWMNLWKPTIDSLGSLLGHTPGAEQWNPNDGRIVELALHCAVDPGAGNNVVLGLRAAVNGNDDDSSPSTRQVVAIPAGSDECSLIDFAMSYNAYDVLDSDRVAASSLRVFDRWHRDGTLPRELATLRTALFWAQRQHKHTEDPQPFNELPIVVALLSQIRAEAPDGVDRVGSDL